MSSIAERLWDRIDPYVATEGVELDDVEVLGGGQIVRVTVDGPDPIGVDTIADLSHGISRLIDDEDPIKGPFTLEVSSPGLERKLTRPRHYEKSIGREITVKTHAQVEGSRSHRGDLIASDSDGFSMTVDESVRRRRCRVVRSSRRVRVWEKGARRGGDS